MLHSTNRWRLKSRSQREAYVLSGIAIFKSNLYVFHNPYLNLLFLGQMWKGKRIHWMNSMKNIYIHVSLETPQVFQFAKKNMKKKIKHLPTILHLIFSCEPNLCLSITFTLLPPPKGQKKWKTTNRSSTNRQRSHGVWQFLGIDSTEFLSHVRSSFAGVWRALATLWIGRAPSGTPGRVAVPVALNGCISGTGPPLFLWDRWVGRFEQDSPSG